MNILEKLKAGVKNSKTSDFHGGILKIRLLSEAEMQQARMEAQAFVKKNSLDEESEMIEKAMRQLFMALSDEEDNKCTETIDSFRKLITRGEREYLIEEYLFLEQECMPSVPGMDNAEFQDILEEVKKSPDSVLNAGNIYTLKRLISYLESRQ
jgi:hypothetical protein